MKAGFLESLENKSVSDFWSSSVNFGIAVGKTLSGDVVRATTRQTRGGKSGKGCHTTWTLNENPTSKKALLAR